MSLVNELIKGLLPEEEKKKVVAVYGGGFKPPTSGHFEVVKQALKENPEIDEMVILIGGKPRNGITPDESILIWDIYKTYLPFKVEVKYTSVPPIKGIYNYAKEHPNEEVLFIIGAREGNEDDFADIATRTKSLDKYPNLNLRTIVTQGGVSGTAARNASKISLEKFKPFVPSELSDEEVEQVYNIIADKIQENNPEDGKAAPYGSGYKKLKENATYSQQIDIIEKVADLTNYMIESGMNIEPLPSMEFIDGDTENAKDFFGKTAYYDPNRQHIVLYTEGRHPKDIVRSYAHEMIHHIQYLEDRLGDVSTTNTMEDDHLDKIEQEANLRGTMTFRNWTDSILNESIIGDKIKCNKCGWSWNIVDGGNDLFTCHKCMNINEGKKKDPFGLIAYARELGQLNEEESEYKVYLDMDGVLADFDQRFRDLSGMEPRDFENKYGKKAFWNLIDEENKIKFWVGIPVMDGATALVNAVKDYNYELLTSPSAKKQSYLGKILWVRNNTGNVFPSKPRINFKKAKEKHLVKPQLAKTDILIDDREDTIGRWNAAGGTGIVYKSIGQVLNDLKKLGL
jgi:proteasome assembly chaperone (PAC2) family protein